MKCVAVLIELHTNTQRSGIKKRQLHYILYEHITGKLVELIKILFSLLRIKYNQICILYSSVTLGAFYFY